VSSEGNKLKLSWNSQQIYSKRNEILPFGERWVGVVEHPVPWLGPLQLMAYFRPELLRVVQGESVSLQILDCHATFAFM
jgi:hypothetical protein